MKHLGLVHFLLILGMGAVMSGTAGGMLTAYQSLMPPSTEVGQTATLIVYLTNNGPGSIQATVSPYPPEVFANGGEQTLELYPGVTQQASYYLTPQQSGSYLIESIISYTENGAAMRSLRLQDAFTVTEPRSGQAGPGGNGFPGSSDNSNPTDNPYERPNGGEMPGGEFPPSDNPGGEGGLNPSSETTTAPEGSGG